MTRKCYIIEQGSYSDYRVTAIFTTRANAEIALARIKDSYDTPLITERDLDPGIDEINSGLIQYGVRFRRDNGTESYDVYPREEFVDSSWEDMHWGPDAYGQCGDHYNVWASSPDHAVKIAAERNAQYHANKV